MDKVTQNYILSVAYAQDEITNLSDAQRFEAFIAYYIAMTELFETTQRERILGKTHASVISEWEIKGPAALAFLDEDIEPTGKGLKFLQDEAAITGESLEELSASVAAKYTSYISLGPKLTGTRRKIVAALKAAPSLDALETTYRAARASAQAEIDRIAQQLGVK